MNPETASVKDQQYQQTYSQENERRLKLWDSPGRNAEVGSHFSLQGIFLTQGSNLGLLHCRQVLYHLIHQGSHQIRTAKITTDLTKI